MSNGPLTDEQMREVSAKAELQVRRYFDHYLTNVFPGQVQQIVKAHDTSPQAHGGVEGRVNRLIWIGLGMAAAGGGGAGVVIKTLLAG